MKYFIKIVLFILMLSFVGIAYAEIKYTLQVEMLLFF